ncbi:jg24231, partial [Pararge aegeria aegeria]
VLRKFRRLTLAGLALVGCKDILPAFRVAVAALAAAQAAAGCAAPAQRNIRLPLAARPSVSTATRSRKHARETPTCARYRRLTARDY